MNFTFNRFFIILISIILIITGLFIPKSIVGIIICLIIASSIFLDEKMGIYLLLITIPIRPFLIIYNTGYKFIGDILILFLLIKVIYNQRKNFRSLFRFNMLEISFLLFILVGVISALITGVKIPAIIMQTRAFLLFYFLYYIVKRLQITNKDVQDFALVTFITAVILSIQGLVEKLSVRTLLLPDVWKNLDLSPTNKIRVYGLIGGPNELGLYLIIAFIISFYLLIKARGKLKIPIYIGMSLILCVFLLTYSRGSIIAVVSFLIIYVLINKKLYHFKSLAIIILASTVLFFAVTKVTNYMEKHIIKDNPHGEIAKNNKDQHEENKNQNQTNGENGLDRLSGTFSKQNIALSNADGRVYYVKKAFEVFKDRPIIGYGFGTFGGAATQTYSSPIYKHYGIKWDFYSDDQYIQILAETGIIGVALIALFVFSLAKFTWPLRKGFPFSPLLIFFLVGGIASGAVYNILENDVFMLYYFIILGYAYRYLDNKMD